MTTASGLHRFSSFSSHNAPHLRRGLRIGRITHLFVRRQALLAAVGATGRSSIRPEKWPGATFQGLNPPNHGSADTRFPVAPATRPAATVAAPLASQPWGIVGSSGSAEQSCLGRRPARRQAGGSGLRRFRIQVGEDLLDHLGILDAGDDPHRAAAGRAGLDDGASMRLSAASCISRSASMYWCVVDVSS